MAAPVQIESVYGVTNIKSHIPLILDTDNHDYDTWRELFLTHTALIVFDVLGHVDGTLNSTCANDHAWIKRDGLFKLWIFGMFVPPLLK